MPSAGSAETAAESAANAATGKKTKTQTREQRTKELQPKFDEFWAAYPKGRKHDKQKCLSRFVSWFLVKGVNDDELFAKIMNGLEAWKKSRDWLEDDGEFVCAPLVWLNNARWESDVQPWERSKGTKPSPGMTLDEERSRSREEERRRCHELNMKLFEKMGIR